MASTLAAHQVKITIVEAQNLTRTNDWNEGSDAYCSIQLHGKVQEGTPHKTSTQKQSLSPKWNETFTVELSHSPMNDTIEIFVWGEKMLGKLFIGRVEIPVTLLLHGAMVDGWFKLLPQSVIDISKTVTGHLHLILHYSQVQVPAPVRVPEKTKTSSSSSYPGNSPAVNCPICNRTFTALTINQHLDLCTQQPPAPTTTTTTTTLTTTKPRGEVGACPVCCKTFPIGELDRHVESCLASQPIEKPKRSKAVPLPSSESEETAQLQAVLIASKLEAQKEKEKRKNEQKENNTTDPLPTIEATPPPSGFAPVYPPLPYMAYPSSGMPMAPPPFIPSPYMAPFPDQSAQPDSTSQPQLPPMYYPPMYPPFYAQPGQPPMVGVPFVGAPSPYAPTTNPPTTLPPQPPKTDLLF